MTLATPPKDSKENTVEMTNNIYDDDIDPELYRTSKEDIVKSIAVSKPTESSATKLTTTKKPTEGIQSTFKETLTEQPNVTVISYPIKTTHFSSPPSRQDGRNTYAGTDRFLDIVTTATDPITWDQGNAGSGQGQTQAQDQNQDEKQDKQRHDLSQDEKRDGSDKMAGHTPVSIAVISGIIAACVCSLAVLAAVVCLLSPRPVARSRDPEFIQPILVELTDPSDQC